MDRLQEQKLELPDRYKNHCMLGKYEYETVDKETGEYSLQWVSKTYTKLVLLGQHNPHNLPLVLKVTNSLEDLQYNVFAEKSDVQFGYGRTSSSLEVHVFRAIIHTLTELYVAIYSNAHYLR